MIKTLLTSVAFFLFAFGHPFYLSVTELKYNAKEKALQGSVKVFISDFEVALKKINHKNTDLINTKDTALVYPMLRQYLVKHFALKLNGRQKPLRFIGYEQEEEAIWMYVEFKNCEAPKKIEIRSSVLYDYIGDQANIVHLDVNGAAKSLKAANPDQDFVFDF